jgi:hypothetical protein
MISFLCGNPVISKTDIRGYSSGIILGGSECLKKILISNKRGKDRIMLTTSGTYPWLFVLTGVVFFVFI